VTADGSGHSHLSFFVNFYEAAVEINALLSVVVSS